MLEPLSVEDVAKEIEMIFRLVDKQLQLIQSTSVQSQEVATIVEETLAGTEEVNASIHEQASTIQQMNHLSHALKDKLST